MDKIPLVALDVGNLYRLYLFLSTVRTYCTQIRNGNLATFPTKWMKYTKFRPRCGALGIVYCERCTVWRIQKYIAYGSAQNQMLHSVRRELYIDAFIYLYSVP